MSDYGKGWLPELRMRLDELHYDLPPELIAQRPAEPRDASRLLVLERATGRIRHQVFRDIVEFVGPEDALVLNNTRVIPARFFARRRSGGRIEGLFLRRGEPCPESEAEAAEAGERWQVLLKPSGRLEVGERLSVEGADVALRLVERLERGEWTVRAEPPTDAVALLERIGQTPLPPYIRPDAGGRAGAPDAADRERYQTVFAASPGAVAAPTAGLHFTPALLEALAARGAARVDVTLHVGLGTFAPIVVDDLGGHRMHAEWYRVSSAALRALRASRAAGGKITAVGTTAVRVLESLPDDVVHAQNGDERQGWTDIFIYPPYRFRHVDRLITNFHLPGSTLLALIMAFAGVEAVRAAYAEAIRQRYRFYSYGDAMLIV